MCEADLVPTETLIEEYLALQLIAPMLIQVNYFVSLNLCRFMRSNY